MAVPEQFSLRWNDFHSNLSQSFQALLEDKDMVDVTLAADDHYVFAHKLILSVCSPYFKELFKTNPCEHPIVILKDVSYQELRQLLQFMYKGEVHVRQQELSGFLHTAELLQVKGLTGSREKSESPPPVSEDEAPNSQVVEPSSDSLPLMEWQTCHDSTLNNESAVNVDEATRSPLKRRLLKKKIKSSLPTKKRQRLTSPSQENTEYTSDGEPIIDSDMFGNIVVLPDSGRDSGWNCKSGGVKCPSCHRFFANRYNLKVHIRDKHDTREGTLQCDICHKRMRNPSCLRVHMYHHRKQASYLAQMSAQGNQTIHAFPNLAGTVARSDSVSDYGDFNNLSASTPNSNTSQGKEVQEAALPKPDANKTV